MNMRKNDVKVCLTTRIHKDHYVDEAYVDGVKMFREFQEISKFYEETHMIFTPCC